MEMRNITFEELTNLLNKKLDDSLFVLQDEIDSYHDVVDTDFSKLNKLVNYLKSSFNMINMTYQDRNNLNQVYRFAIKGYIDAMQSCSRSFKYYIGCIELPAAIQNNINNHFEWVSHFIWQLSDLCEEDRRLSIRNSELRQNKSNSKNHHRDVKEPQYYLLDLRSVLQAALVIVLYDYNKILSYLKKDINKTDSPFYLLDGQIAALKRVFYGAETGPKVLYDNQKLLELTAGNVKQILENLRGINDDVKNSSVNNLYNEIIDYLNYMDSICTGYNELNSNKNKTDNKQYILALKGSDWSQRD